jgi:hypothetical protein
VGANITKPVAVYLAAIIHVLISHPMYAIAVNAMRYVRWDISVLKVNAYSHVRPLLQNVVREAIELAVAFTAAMKIASICKIIPNIAVCVICNAPRERSAFKDDVKSPVRRDLHTAAHQKKRSVAPTNAAMKSVSMSKIIVIIAAIAINLALRARSAFKDTVSSLARPIRHHVVLQAKKFVARTLAAITSA